MDDVMREAVEWVVELSSAEVSMERVVEWQRWLKQSPHHAQEFSRIEAMLGRVEKIRNIPWPSEAELAADGTVGFRPGRRFEIPFAIAAGLALVCALLILGGYPRALNVPGVVSIDRVETPAGGTQKILLADGSAVDVSGKSRLRATLTRHAREITLERGEAFFRVANDPARPFVVHAGKTSITAIGTAFNVRRSGERVVVAVAEGSVRIAAPDFDTQLHAGEQASAERRAGSLEKTAIDTDSVAGWRDGRLRYLNEPLGIVVADVGRYTARDIQIADPALKQLRITGTVLEHNLDGWLTSLEEAFPVAAIRNPDASIVITTAPRH